MFFISPKYLKFCCQKRPFQAETAVFVQNMQPWESVVTVSNAVVNAILYGIYDSKEIAFVRFSRSVVCGFHNLHH